MKIQSLKLPATAVWLLLCSVWLLFPARSGAQLVLGSWQNNSGDGWTDSSSVSITNAANYPVKYEFETGVVAGYAQSLGLHETGFGNVRLMINLTSVNGGIAAFTNGTKLQFTFSCPPDSGAAAGYMQLVQFQYNSPGSGFKQVTGSWAANGFSETGSTGNNSGGQPIFYFYGGSPARSQVVTWDYSSVKTNILSSNPTYLQITFVFQAGGGAPTNVLMNNVVLLAPPTPQIIVDQFNPTNNPYAGANIYAAGNITNIYANWFGSAFDNVVWDGTTDAATNSNSGALKITANFGTGGGDQFVVMDKGPSFSYAGINPPITNGFSLLTFECDVKYAPTSPTWTTGGTTTYGHLEFGLVPPFSPQDIMGSINVPTTNSGWTHVTIPLNPKLDTNLLSISGLIIKMDGASYGNLQGTTVLWVDNLQFTYTNTPPVIPPPVMGITPAKPGLRIFAGDTSSQFSRAEVATVDQNQSWVGGTFPVSYSFKLLSYDSGINQNHLFLVPVNSTPNASPYGYNGVDYTATNGLWLTISPGAGGTVVGSVLWKTNQPNANPSTVALRITNSTAVGTWTLTFTANDAGTLTAPGASPAAFTIADSNVATDFANPMVAYFGLQPNSVAGEGLFEDWGSISVNGVAGVQENEDFTQATSQDIAASGNWRNMSATATSLGLVPTSVLPAYWVNWTLPAVGYGLGTAMDVLGNTNTSAPWMLPEYYNGYGDGNNIPGTAVQGTKTWLLVPYTCLPTSDGNPGGPISPNAYFKLFNPPLVN